MRHLSESNRRPQTSPSSTPPPSSTPTPPPSLAQEINQMEREMCSYLEWQLNVELSALKELESMVRKDFKGLGPYLAHYPLPVPSSGPFAHLKPSTNTIPAAIPSFSPGAPPSPPSAKSSRQSSVKSYPTPTDVPQLPSPPSSHLNIPSPANSMHSNVPSPANLMSPATSTVVAQPPLFNRRICLAKQPFAQPLFDSQWWRV